MGPVSTSDCYSGDSCHHKMLEFNFYYCCWVILYVLNYLFNYLKKSLCINCTISNLDIGVDLHPGSKLILFFFY